MKNGYRMMNSRNSFLTNIIILFILGIFLPVDGFSNKATTTGQSVDYASALKLLPAKALVNQTLFIDFENNGTESLALVYQKPLADYPHEVVHRTTSGLIIMSHHLQKGWEVIHHEPASSGSPESIVCDILKLQNNSNALFVQYSYSGAGVSADWSLFAIRNNKLLMFDRMPILERVLKDKDYVFMGYNRASVVDKYYINESIAGYSKAASRCCPDRPALVVRYTFTGSSIEVVSVADKEEHDGKLEQTSEANLSRDEETLLSEKEAKTFISNWLKLSEKNDNFIQVMSMYAENVSLYKFGEVNKSFVAKDKDVYFKKWPIRKYTIEDLVVLPDKSADIKRVHVTYHFSISNYKKTITGNAKSILQIRKNKGAILIASEKGEVL